MFVFNENDQDIPFITVDYCSVLLKLFISYTSLMERGKTEW